MDALDIMTPQALIEIATKKGKEFKTIKTNQIRNFFSAILSIKNQVQLAGKDFNYSQIETELLLLKPKLAYAAGRQSVVRPYKEFMDAAIEAVEISQNKEKALLNFFNLIESVVAYHKYHGGN
jgi:CRISPR-associated protein Csm2